MMDANSVGRLTCLSPVTWQDGWPYFGLPGNLGRTPRTWVKPAAGARERPRAPYARNDDFDGPELGRVWQWNHVPAEGQWSLRERPGFLRLHAQPAASLWEARNSLTQRAMGPRSTPTAVLDTAGMKAGDTAGLGLFLRPYAWIGVERGEARVDVVQFDEQSGEAARVRLEGTRVWLRAECDFLNETARFRYSTDGRTFHELGRSFTMVFGLTTFQGVRYSLFSYHAGAGPAVGYADFDSFEVAEPQPRGLSRPIPFGRKVELRPAGRGEEGMREKVELRPAGRGEEGMRVKVEDRGLGRASLAGEKGYLSVAADGTAAWRRGRPGRAETFQWIETFTGELVLLSLETNRYLRRDFESGALRADSPGPRPDGEDGVRWGWAKAR
jgi:hypothetical protein